MDQREEARVLQDIANEITCPVCLEIFEQPLRLDCDHTFCRKCLVKLVKGETPSLVCPACREVTTMQLPGILGVARLRTDHRVARLKDTYRSNGAGGAASKSTSVSNDEAESPESPHEVPQYEHVELKFCCEIIHSFIPFSIKPEQCQDLFQRWKRALWLCPTDFPERAILRNVRMVCVPFFLFSVTTHTKFKATVFCPQDGRSSLPAKETRSEVRVTHTSLPDTEGSYPHESQRWVRGAIGTTVTEQLQRDESKNVSPGWGTWILCRAAPFVGQWTASSHKEHPKALKTAEETDDGTGTELRINNCEASVKVGQNYVSSTQPMQRRLNFSGDLTNSYPQMLVCASHAIDQDLVASLMTGRQKDEDLKLLKPITTPHPTQNNVDEYLQLVHKEIFKEGGGGGARTRSPSPPTPSPRTSSLYPTPSSSAVPPPLTTATNSSSSSSSSTSSSTPSSRSKRPPSPPVVPTHRLCDSDDDSDGLCADVLDPDEDVKPAKAGTLAPRCAAATDGRRAGTSGSDVPVQSWADRIRAGSKGDKEGRNAKQPSPALSANSRSQASSGGSNNDSTGGNGKKKKKKKKGKGKGDTVSERSESPAAHRLPQSSTDPNSVYEEFMRPPARGRGADDDLMDPPFSSSRPDTPDIADIFAADSVPVSRSDGMKDSMFIPSFLRTVDPAVMNEDRPPWGASSSAPPPSAPSHAPAPATSSSATSSSSSPSPPVVSFHPAVEGSATPGESTASLVAAAMEQDYFSICKGEEVAVAGETSFGVPEVLAPERKSEDTWNEQIWPHIKERELEFTRGVIRSMQPSGAVVDKSTIELTVTTVKHKAILLPCYVATYSYQGQLYDLVVHGRTGEVHGKRPWIGSTAYANMKRGVKGQVNSVRAYIEDSLDNLGVI